jgi:hypothetical protein
LPKRSGYRRGEQTKKEPGKGHNLQVALSEAKLGEVNEKSNWLAGSLSGPKSPISRHTSRFFLTIALLWPAKNRFDWRKMDPFLAQTRPANQLLKKITTQRLHGISITPNFAPL